MVMGAGAKMRDLQICVWEFNFIEGVLDAVKNPRFLA